MKSVASIYAYIRICYSFGASFVADSLPTPYQRRLGTYGEDETRCREPSKHTYTSSLLSQMFVPRDSSGFLYFVLSDHLGVHGQSVYTTLTIGF